MSYQGRAMRYGLVMVAVEEAIGAARAAVRRYETALEDAREKIRSLKEREEEALERLRVARRRLADAEVRLADAQRRMTAATFNVGLLSAGAEPFAMAEQAAAQREADQAQTDITEATTTITTEEGELRELRGKAKRERTQLVEAEQAAAAAVRGAAGRLPDVQLPGGATSPSAYAGTIFAGPLSPFERDPRWSAAMAKAAAEEEDEPSALEKAWDGALQRFGQGTPLDFPLTVAETVSPGFREDYGRALTEGVVLGVKDTLVLGVQLSAPYRLLDPAGQDRAVQRLGGAAAYARDNKWDFFKNVSGIADIEQGNPGTAFGNWSLAAIPGGAGVKAVTTTTKLVPDLTTVEGARDVMRGLTADANQRLGENIRTALDDGLLSAKEYEAGQNFNQVAPMSYGKAVERDVARTIRASPVLSESLLHLGGPNQPDFTITLPNKQTVNFDITTNNETGIARHLERPYGPGLQIIPYERPDGVVPFPPDPPPDP